MPTKSSLALLALSLLPSVVHGTECDSMAQDVRCMYSTDMFADKGSYNSLRNQVAFCKMQGFDTVSRDTSGGPSVFTSGLVKIGVGLSKNQFGSDDIGSWLNMTQGAAACGMCIEVLAVDNMPALNDQLTKWDYKKNVSVPFIAMIFDQCTDPICEWNGYLDFDVYSEEQPVAKGNPRLMEWRAVDCPTGDKHKLEYLFCVPDSCNIENAENTDRFGEIFNPYWFAVNVRNSRIPIICVSMEDTKNKDEWVALNYTSGVGWTWTGHEFHVDGSDSFRIKLTSADGQEVIETILIDDVLEKPSTPGYRSGLLYLGKEQFGPSHF